MFYLKTDPESLSKAFNQCHLKIIKALTEARQY